MDITLYGIKNCDTMKKAFKWLESHGIAYTFYDYKKHGVDTEILQRALDIHGWEIVLNRRGTTWRQLSDQKKAKMNNAQALKTAQDNPSIIKRPMLVKGDNIVFGFKDSDYAEIFKI